MVLLGIDFGSGGCKITAVNEDGLVLGSASVEYPTIYKNPNWSEQCPDDWYAAMVKALASLKQQEVPLMQTVAISFDGSTHNAVLLDEQMKPVRNTIMWTDQRSVQQCQELKEKLLDKIFSTAYQYPTPTWTLPQLMWLRCHEPETLKKVKHILFVKDYVRYLVTGRAVTDYIEAQGTLFFDMAKQQWSAELFGLTELPMTVLPELIKPTDIAGYVLEKAAGELGIPAGIPVVCGTSDSAVEDYGAGAIEPGDCIIKLATAGNVNVMTSKAHPYPATLTYSHIIPGMWYTVSATNAAALCQRWLRDLCCETEKLTAQDSGKNVFEIMDDLAYNSPVGANGVMFHPYLQGERSPYWDPDLRASFTGLAISSTKGDLIRAVLEGVAFSLLDCYGVIKEMQIPVKRVILIGGGAKSALWSEIVCNVFNLPVQIPTPGDASFGTALLAGAGTGIFADSSEAVKTCLKVKREIIPNPETVGKYTALFAKYRAIHDVLAPIYKNN